MTDQFSLPEYFGDPLLRAAVLGQLGRREEAAAALASVRQLRPDLFSGIEVQTDLEEVVRRIFQAEDRAERLIEGLRKAGLE